MNYTEAKQFIIDSFLPLIHKRMEKIYPDMFVKCSTRDGEVYTKANGNMYTYYIAIARGLHRLPETPLVYYRDIENSDYSYIQKMYDDFKEADRPIEWLIEYVPIS